MVLQVMLHREEQVDKNHLATGVQGGTSPEPASRSSHRSAIHAQRRLWPRFLLFYSILKQPTTANSEK